MIYPHFSDYTNGECIDYLSRFKERIDNAELEASGVKPSYNMMVGLFDKALESYLPANEIIATSKISNSDAKRDEINICFRGIVYAYRNFYNENERNAALNIFNSMAKYGDRIEKLNYVTETSAVTNLCKELTTDPELVANVATLHLEQVVQDLQKANVEFNTLYNARLDQKEVHNEVQFAADLKKATTACRNFYKLVEATIAFAPTDALLTIEKKLDLLANEYNEVAIRRIAKNNTKPSSETTIEESTEGDIE